jgi:hypothetical protein
VTDLKALSVNVTGEPPLNAAPPTYSNFLGVSRLGNDVQFEFIFVDINFLAGMVEAAKKEPQTAEPTPVKGQTVAKMVMPAQSFLQLQSHFEKLFADIKSELEKQGLGEKSNESDQRKRASH